MKLWLLSTPYQFGHDDTYDSFICVANTEQEARNTHPNLEFGWKWNGYVWQIPGRDDFYAHDWVDPNLLIVKEVGTANEDITGVLCASFNAA